MHYLFIDGKYLDMAYESLMTKMFYTTGALDISAIPQSTGTERTFYYAAIDDAQRFGETDSEFTTRLNGQISRFEAINALPGFHTRLGSVTGRSHKRRRQKQVDVQLAVDALIHSFNKNVSSATFIAGDLDFRPLVEAIVSLGVRTTVLYERRSAARDLYRTADIAVEITLQRAWEWSTADFRTSYPLPQVSLNESPPPNPVSKEGAWGDRTIRLYQLPTNLHQLFVLPHNREYAFSVRAANLDSLMRFFEIMYGTIEWK